jgi:hypothetical protein
MSAQENKILSNRVAQAISEGDLEALDELMAPELADEFKRDVAEIRRAFPDYAGTNVEQIAAGEEVANRLVFLGTPRRVRGGKPDRQAGRVCRPFHRSGGRGQDRGELGGGGHARRDAAARSGTRAGTIHFAVIDHSLRLRLLAVLSIGA